MRVLKFFCFFEFEGLIFTKQMETGHEQPSEFSVPEPKEVCCYALVAYERNQG
jgi:hypothetical protein